jgi:hypothetical protein
MDIADRNGIAFLRVLRSADRISDSAIFLGLVIEKTPLSRSSALLFRMTTRDHDFNFVIVRIITYNQRIEKKNK